MLNSDNPPSAKSVRKMVKSQKSNAEKVMATATKALENISSRYDGSLEKKGEVKCSLDDFYQNVV